MTMPHQDQSNRHRETVKVGRCGLAGPLAPWMAPSSQGRVYGVSCHPHRPRPEQSRFGFGFGFGCRRCPGLKQVRGAACRLTLPAHENDFTDFSKPSSLRHASTILRSSRGDPC